MERNVSSVGRWAWPFYIVCDVSASMHRKVVPPGELTPYEAMHEALHELVDFAQDYVIAADIAHIALVTFADDAQVQRSLRRLGDGFEVGTLPKGMYTDYAKVFAKLNELLEEDLPRLESEYQKVKRPAVFFITDGKPTVGGISQPSAEWRPPLDRLHSFAASRPTGEDAKIAVVALGFEDADCKILRQVAKEPGIAAIADAGAVSTRELMQQLIGVILDTASKTVAEGDFSFSVPDGMKLC
jgi:uncharacterized protein YegL